MSESPEKSRKEKKYKNQIHLRLGEDITTALEDRAKEEGITVTALVIKYMKQGLGWEGHPPPNIDIAEIENRISESVLKRISQPDEAALETRIYDRVSERVSQDWINYTNELEIKIYNCISKRISELQSALVLQPLDSSIGSVSSSNTNRYTEDSVQANPTEELPDIQAEEQDEQDKLSGQIPLFDSIHKGQIEKLPNLIKYLNQVVDPNAEKPWNRERLRLYKKRLLTYLKKPLEKRQGDPPCPVIINGYLLDWVPVEDEPIHSYGKQWWIQRLPSNPDEAERLITTRRKQWNNLP